MIEQQSLLDAPTPLAPSGRPLTAKQALAYQIVRESPGGITADELGAHFHAHGPDVRCDWCARTGLGFLRSKGLGSLVVRRRGGMWQPRDGSGVPVVGAGSQLRELPDDFFGASAA